MHCSIELDDDESGSVAAKLIFSGGFDKRSGAHQAGQILIGLMDQYMKRLGNAVIDPLVVDAHPALAVPDVESTEIILSAR